MADTKQSDLVDYSGNIASDDRYILRRPSDPSMSPTTGTQVEVAHSHVIDQVIHRGTSEPTGAQTLWWDTDEEVLPSSAFPIAEPNALSGSPLLTFWYRASTIGLANGAAVSSWSDSGPNGYTLTQPTGTKQPTYRTAGLGLNGQPAVRFDGTDDTLRALSTGAASMPTPTFFAVFYNPNTIASFFVFDARGANFMDVFVSASVLTVRCNSDAGAVNGNPQEVKGAYVVVGSYNGSQLTMYVNGVARGAIEGGTLAAVTPSNIWAGSNNDSTFANVDLAEFGCFGAGLTAYQRQQLTNGLMRRYGIGAFPGVAA